MSCGGETLPTFLDRAGGNVMYTSKVAVVEFVNALGTWVEESPLKWLHKAPIFSIMADEMCHNDRCTNDHVLLYIYI